MQSPLPLLSQSRSGSQNQAGSEISRETVLEFLRQRRTRLNAVCISGGEPTLQPDLVPFIGEIRDMGCKVKSDTNGSRPEVLKRAFGGEGLLDYAALDIKSSPAKYRQETGDLMDFEASCSMCGPLRTKKSAMNSGLQRCRASSIWKAWRRSPVCSGPVPRFALQQFRPKQTLDPFHSRDPLSSDLVRKCKGRSRGWAEEFIVRGI